MRVLKFGAVWCPGCLVMQPRWEKIEKEHTWLQTRYYEFEKNQKMFVKYKIGENLPVFIFLDKDNQELFRLTGEISEKKLLEIIKENKDQ